MGKWRSWAMASVVALAQLVSPPYAAAQTSGAPDGTAGTSGCTPLASAIPPLPMAPLKDDVTAVITVTIERGPTISHVGVGVSSGDPARDEALIAHVMKNWRLESCGLGRFRFRVHFPRLVCDPQPLLETQTPPDLDDYPDRPRSTQLQVGLVPDGTVETATVTRSSGDAALDRAAVAHVRKAWRWQPFSCPGAQAVLMGTATINFPYMTPEPPPR